MIFRVPVDEKSSKRRGRAGGDAMNSFDQILGSMLLPPGSAKIKKQSGSFSETSSNSSRKLGNFCFILFVSVISLIRDIFSEISSRHATADIQHHTLTKERLERHVAAVEGHHFAQKGLMEALLEHKMNTGRIEPHAQLAPKLNFTAFLKGPQTPPGTPPSPRVAAQNDRAGAGGRGPKTPQNTPPDSASLRSPSSASSVARSSENVVSVVGTGSLQNFEATVPSNAAPKNNSNATETTATLETVARLAETGARLANIEPSQVAQCLSMDALQTLRDVDPTVLVATLSTLLGSIMRTVSAKKSAKKHSNVDDRSFQRERNEEQQVTSTCMLTEMDESKSNIIAAREQQVEMEIASSGSDTPIADSRHETSTTPTKSKTTLHNQDVGTPSSSYHPIQMTPSPGRHPPLPPPPPLPFDLSRPPPIIGLSSVHVAPQGPLTFPPPIPLHIPAPPPPAVALDFSVPPPCLVTNQLAPAPIPNDTQFDVFAAQLQAVTLAFLSQMSPESVMQLATDDSNPAVGFVSVLNTKKSTRFFKDYHHQSDPELLGDPNFSIVFPPSVNQQSDPNDIPRVINYDNRPSSSSSTSHAEQHNFVEPRRRQTPPPPSFFDDVSRNSLPPSIETSMTVKEIQPMTERSTLGYDRKPFNERRRGSFRGARGGRGKGSLTDFFHKINKKI